MWVLPAEQGQLLLPGGSTVKGLKLLRKLSMRFGSDEAGAAAIEYCLIAAGAGLAVFGAVKLLGPNLGSVFGNVAGGGRTADQHLIRLNK